MNYFKRIIDLYTNGHISDTGKVAFSRWLADKEHASEKDKALRELWHSAAWNEKSGDGEVPATFRKRVPGNKMIKSVRLWQSAAAALLIIAVSSLYMLFGTKDSHSGTDLIEQYVPVAEISHVILPDGSEVQLNANSVLLYPSHFPAHSRSVYLIGEANFKVTENKDKPFTVKVSGMQITVLGTEFNVHAYSQDSLVRTTVLSGSVKTEYNNLRSETILSPNQQLAFNRYTGRSTLSRPDLQYVTAWQRGEIAFMSTTMTEVMRVLERKFPYTFIYNKTFFSDDKYTFKFRENAPLEEVMDVISQVAGYIAYTIENNTCTIETNKKPNR